MASPFNFPSGNLVNIPAFPPPKSPVHGPLRATTTTPYTYPPSPPKKIPGTPVTVITTITDTAPVPTGLPRFHSTGPVAIWVRFPKIVAIAGGQEVPTSKQKPYYLGTCEQHPIQEEEVINLPVYDDESMAASPRDREYAGSNEMIVLPLNRFNYSVLNMLVAFPRYRQPDGTGKSRPPGQNGHMDRGALIVGSGYFFELWLVNTYFGTRVAKPYPSMPVGTYYPFCSLSANNTPKQGAGRTQIRMLAVEANWNYNEPQGLWFMKSNESKYFETLK